MLLASANIGYCSRSSAWQFLWIHFKGYGCREFFRSVCADGLFFLHPENPEPIYSLYKRLIPLLSTHTLANDLHTSELLGTFLHTIARYQLWGEEKRIPAAIEQTIAFIHENYHGNLSVEQLAERENYSVYHFTKLFKKYTGQSPYQYILSTRLRHAQQMLLSTDYTIEEVSRFNNFSSCSRFISIFTKAFGMPPSGTVRILLSRVIQSGDLSLVTGHLFFIGSESYATPNTVKDEKSG
jgi:AraC-like DNA-binding protein